MDLERRGETTDAEFPSRGTSAPVAPSAEDPPLRIGLVFCRCGSNLGNVVDLSALALEKHWPGAPKIREHDFLCSPEGRRFLQAFIEEEHLERVVVAACSPREHEQTFQDVLADAGLNPFCLQMANIREQVEWVGSDRPQATRKARRTVTAALRRVRFHRPLERREMEASPDVLVIGSGVAGLSAALTLAQKTRRVYLVERDATLGGRTALLDDLFPGGECASCFLDPVLQRLIHHPGISVMTLAEVEDVRGAWGNFRVRIAHRPRRVDPALCIGCNSCAGVCPVEVPTRFIGAPPSRAVGIPYSGCQPNVSRIREDICLRNSGASCDLCAKACPFGAIRLEEETRHSEITVGAIVLATGSEPHQAPCHPPRPDVITCLELERLLHPHGPTSGRVLLPGGDPPRSILLVLSERARGEARLARAEIAKLARRLSEKMPGTLVAAAGLLPAPEEEGPLLDELRRHGVSLLVGTLRGPVRPLGAGGPLEVTLDDGSRLLDLTAEMVVVYTPTFPSPGAQELARILRLRPGPEGFFPNRPQPFEPASTPVRGIYVAGCAAGSRTVHEAIADGSAAAAPILSLLVPGERLPLEPTAALVLEDRCSGCGVCRAACPFGAIEATSGGTSFVEAGLCRGCGTCAAACPSGAIAGTHFLDEQLHQEILGLMER
jgi:heterodisulfide reductase subunit A